MHDRKNIQKDKRASGVTFRAILIGLAFVPINVYLVVQWETVWGTQYPTTMGILFNAIFCLFIVALLNIVIKKFLPQVAFSQGELLTVYTILLISISVSGHDFSQSLFCTLGTAHWSATSENEWNELFARYVPRWLTVNDDDILRAFYEGQSTFYISEYIKGWIRPMLWWTTFLTVVGFVMLCINIIVRKQWIERERLTYPLVQLPLEMTRENGKTSFFKNRLLWLSFGIAFGLDLLNGLNYLYPVVPKINLAYNLANHFVDKPLNSINRFSIQINPYAIGLAFPIPLDLLFSCWFFYLIWKAESVLGGILGVNLPGYPFSDQQILGAYLGITVVILWLGRKTFWKVLKKVINKSEVDDSEEPMSYRSAVLGGIAGVVFLVVFAYKAGMSVLFALAFWGIYFAILFSFTRMRAELGPPLQGIHYSGPFQLIVASVGSRKISAQTLTVAAPYWTFTKEFRNYPMPFQLEGFKMAEKSGIDTKKLWKVMMLSVAVGVFITFWAFLQLNYKWGGVGAWRGRSAYNTVQRWITIPTTPDASFLGAAGFGVIFVIINTVLRLRFIWWPLHPLGYPLAGYYHFDKLWFPFFISWIVKWTILRFGGMKAYRKAIPFFLGLVLGEFVMGSIWGILGLATGMPTYAFKSW